MAHNSKVVPFPAPTAEVPAEPEAYNRIVLHLGKQRVAFDISCRATVLKPAALAPDANVPKPRKNRRPGRG